MFKLGITGHQRRPTADWEKVRKAIDTILNGIEPPICGYSSLAAGADQAFAKAILACGGFLKAVIPTDDYERTFQPNDLVSYHALRTQSDMFELRSPGNPELAFLEAGRWIVDQVDLMIAVWDGQPAKGVGGTADIVAYARHSRVPLDIIDPDGRLIARERTTLVSRAGEVLHVNKRNDDG